MSFFREISETSQRVHEKMSKKDEFQWQQKAQGVTQELQHKISKAARQGQFEACVNLGSYLWWSLPRAHTTRVTRTNDMMNFITRQVEKDLPEFCVHGSVFVGVFMDHHEVCAHWDRPKTSVCTWSKLHS